MTFTNRLGQIIYLKLSSEDEPKSLRVSDTRASFVYRESGRPNEIQVSVSLYKISYEEYRSLVRLKELLAVKQ